MASKTPLESIIRIRGMSRWSRKRCRDKMLRKSGRGLRKWKKLKRIGIKENCD